jgi:hypothetical protein
MAEGAYGRMGFARTYALIFGIAYIAVALLEVILGDLEVGGFVLLDRTTIQNIVHWAVGVVVLGSFFAGEAAARMVEDKALSGPLEERYAGWNDKEAQRTLSGGYTLEEIAHHVVQHGIEPQPRSGRQELLENVVNRYV